MYICIYHVHWVARIYSCSLLACRRIREKCNGALVKNGIKKYNLLLLFIIFIIITIVVTIIRLDYY